jgi:hypothetical protein
MKTVPTATKCTNLDVKRAIILFPRLELRNLEKGQYHTYKLRTTPSDPTSSVYELSVPFFDEGVVFSITESQLFFYNLQCAWAKVGEVRHPCNSIEQENK